MNVEADILFTVHEGAPFCRSMMLALITYSKGAPFYNAISSRIQTQFVDRPSRLNSGRLYSSHRSPLTKITSRIQTQFVDRPSRLNSGRLYSSHRSPLTKKDC